MSIKSRLSRLGAVMPKTLPKPRSVPVEEWETVEEACERLEVPQIENGFPVFIIGYSADFDREESHT